MTPGYSQLEEDKRLNELFKLIRTHTRAMERIAIALERLQNEQCHQMDALVQAVRNR